MFKGGPITKTLGTFVIAFWGYSHFIADGKHDALARDVTGTGMYSSELSIDNSNVQQGPDVTVKAGTRLVWTKPWNAGTCALAYDEKDYSQGTVFKWVLAPCDAVTRL